MNKIQEQCEELLFEKEVDINSEIDFDVNGKVHTLSFKYIIKSFMQASQESQEVFLIALQKASNAKEMGIDKFFQSMGQLILMTHLSDKIEI